MRKLFWFIFYFDVKKIRVFISPAWFSNFWFFSWVCCHYPQRCVKFQIFSLLILTSGHAKAFLYKFIYLLKCIFLGNHSRPEKCARWFNGKFHVCANQTWNKNFRFSVHDIFSQCFAKSFTLRTKLLFPRWTKLDRFWIVYLR